MNTMDTSNKSGVTIFPAVIVPGKSDCDSAAGNQRKTEMDGLENKFDRALRLEAEVDHRVPTEDLTQEELDSLFARDMYSLTIEERAKVLNDMHGVPDAIEEKPSFVLQHRNELTHKLESLVANTHQDTKAYEQALAQDNEYVTGSKTQMAFLRAEGFDVTKAALRLVKFFKLKLDLFGPNKLTKDISIKDMSKEDKKSIESGFFQLLPVRDAAGRAIMMGMPCLRNYKDEINFKRGFYYMVMTAIHDQSTQKSGLIFVGYNMGKSRTVDRTAAWCVSQLRKILPMRVVGVHYLYDDFRTRAMMTVAMLVMGGANRVRFRAHYGKPHVLILQNRAESMHMPPNKQKLPNAGTLEDNFYKLQTFGIPTEALPITADGEPKNKYHRQWLKTRGKQEGTPEFRSDEFIVVPNRLDVLFGRGKPIQEHFGNIRYHTLLDYYQDAYERAKKFEKMQISQRVVDTVHAFDGRFLKQEGSGWVAVDDLIARDKVSHAFRTRRASNPSFSGAEQTKSSVVKRFLDFDSPGTSSSPSSVATTFHNNNSNDPSTVTDTEDEGDFDGGKRARTRKSIVHEVRT